MAGGHGYGDDDGELRSVVCAGGKQRRERGPGEEREGWTAPGGCVASPRMDRLEGEASSTKQEVAGVGARASSTQLLRGEGEEDDWQLGCTVTGRAEAGPAGLPGEQQVGLLLFFYLLFSILFLFNSFATVLNLK